MLTNRDVLKETPIIWTPEGRGWIREHDRAYDDHRWNQNYATSGIPAISIQDMDDDKSFTPDFDELQYVDLKAIPIKFAGRDEILLYPSLRSTWETTMAAVEDQYARCPLARDKMLALYFERGVTYEGTAQRTPSYHIDTAKNAEIEFKGRDEHEIDHDIPIQIYMRSNIYPTFVQAQKVNDVEEVFTNKGGVEVKPPYARMLRKNELALLSNYTMHSGSKSDRTGDLRNFFALSCIASTKLSEKLHLVRPLEVPSLSSLSLTW